MEFFMAFFGEVSGHKLEILSGFHSRIVSSFLVFRGFFVCIFNTRKESGFL
jgi:hypothetical protein